MVSANPDAWNGEPWEIERSRVLREYTAEQLSQRYGGLNEADIPALMRFPVLFAQENANGSAARVGWITRIRHRANEVRVEYVLDPAFPSIAPERLLEFQWDLDLTDWEMNRTHWALKDVDLFPVLVEKGLIHPGTLNAQPPGSRIAEQGFGQRIDIPAQPRVFRLPAAPPEADLVSVMMPFSPEFGVVFGAIQNACMQSGLRCVRADNIWQESEVIQDIFSLIFRSKIVVCDFTRQNPNVFYETGIAHTLGKHVVPIAQNGNDAPFDLRHHRYLTYTNTPEGLELLAQALTPRLRTLRDLA
ncbi:hypothetical protein [Tardiphaga sp.]|jgi:hypothetical protein|uniref:hypothetical protein n=1 Tax=Tardiphaga sp. TaxID=1926292 RepID=UPI0037DA6196